MSSWPADFCTIRAWEGSQYRAFEELCYQLRPEAPPGARLIKTGDPDAGLEWYFVLENAEEWGWQAKYSFELRSLLSQMRTSAKRAVEQRPALTRPTFCIPIDRALDDERSALTAGERALMGELLVRLADEQ